MSLDYPIAKKLSDAGFPQGGRGTWLGDPAALVVRSGDRVYVPTLEELIEACGLAFGGLVKGSQNWAATSNALIVPLCASEGLTSTEAVARLWLSLQKISRDGGD